MYRRKLQVRPIFFSLFIETSCSKKNLLLQSLFWYLALIQHFPAFQSILQMLFTCEEMQTH